MILSAVVDLTSPEKETPIKKRVHVNLVSDDEAEEAEEEPVKKIKAKAKVKAVSRKEEDKSELDTPPLYKQTLRNAAGRMLSSIPENIFAKDSPVLEASFPKARERPTVLDNDYEWPDYPDFLLVDKDGTFCRFQGKDISLKRGLVLRATNWSAPRFAEDGRISYKVLVCNDSKINQGRRFSGWVTYPGPFLRGDHLGF